MSEDLAGFSGQQIEVEKDNRGFPLTEILSDKCTFRVPSRGDLCPVCAMSKLDYDGMLDLRCAVCGYQAPGGGFT